MPISLFSVGTNTRCPGEFTKRPPISISPLSGRSNPATQRSVVVLPHPLGPNRTQNSPSPTSRSMLFKASTRPWWDLNDLHSALMLIIQELPFSKNSLLCEAVTLSGRSVAIRNCAGSSLGRRAYLAHSGEDDPQSAHNDHCEENQDHAQSRHLRNPSTTPKLPHDSRNHDVIARIQSQRHSHFTVREHAYPDPTVQNTGGNQGQNNADEHSRG